MSNYVKIEATQTWMLLKQKLYYKSHRANCRGRVDMQTSTHTAKKFPENVMKWNECAEIKRGYKGASIELFKVFENIL